MDRYKKRILQEFEDMEKHLGRMMRNLSIPRMNSLQSGSWMLAADLYETENELILCMDAMGIEPEDLNVVVEQKTVTVSGKRTFPINDKVCCIHQMEIERGFFERAVPLPLAVDNTKATSSCKNGLLIIRMPLQTKRDETIKITVR